MNEKMKNEGKPRETLVKSFIKYCSIYCYFYCISVYFYQFSYFVGLIKRFTWITSKDLHGI